MAAASPAVIRPSSGISANSMAARCRADARYGSQEPCLGGRAVLPRDDAFDPTFGITDLGIQHGLEGIVHALDAGGDVLLPARCDLRHKPFAHLNDLGPARCQSSENTQVLTRQPSSGFWPEQHEPGDEFRIDPVCLRAGAPGKGKGFYLRRGQLLRVDPRRALRANKSETFDSLKFTLEGAGERFDGNARTSAHGLVFRA